MTSGLDEVRTALTERYEIVRELGRGGMAVVYLANDRRHERAVALKVLRPELAAALGPERFGREIKVVASLQHPHILPLYDSGERDGILFYVMPYMGEESLRGRLRREGPLPIVDALRITREVADALDYAHERGIVHRDIKPENILLSDGHAWVADFGVARAVRSAAEARLTDAGLAVGTPAYMSPEQASGERELDGRSDVYSLACVVYEMLAGTAPFAAQTPRGLLAMRFRDSVPRLDVVRREVPAHLGAVVARAMALDPADRFATAGEFARALPRLSITQEFAVRARGLSRWAWTGIAAGVLFAGILPASWQLLGSGPSLDESLVAVMPFAQRGGDDGARRLDGEQARLLLHEALSRWQGIRLVDGLRINDATLRAGAPRPGLAAQLEMARAFGAGRLMSGEVWQLTDTVFVRAAVYDVAGGSVLREYTVRLDTALVAAGPRFDELADSLLRDGIRPDGIPGGAMGTRHLAAWRAYQRGHAALMAWQLDAARRHFRDATRHDPRYALAHLWLAEVSLWSDVGSTEDWRDAAASVVALASTLTPRDRELAAAHLAMAERRYAQACTAFRRLIARDSLDFTAWYGLGECLRRDRLVVPDPKSPSKWRFRASYHEAAEAYRRALQIIPSIHAVFRGAAFQRLGLLLPTESTTLRAGYALTPDTARFAAYASLHRDTLALIPYPWPDIAQARAATTPRTAGAASARNRAVLREITGTWVRAFPGSADAHEAHALVLESMARLGGPLGGGPSALATTRRARALRPPPDQALRLAVAEARLQLKLGNVDATRRLADSLLRAVATPSPAEALQLAALAAVTGRVHRAAALLRQGATSDSSIAADGAIVMPDVAPPLLETSRALLAYAALGVPADSLVVLERRVEQLVESWIPAADRDRVRDDLLAAPRALGFPTIGAAAARAGGGRSNTLARLQTRFARADTAGLRAAFDSLQLYRRAFRPGEIAIRGTFHEARLLLAVGDTATAAEALDLSLDALPTLGAELLRQVSQAASLVRAMALRAELAHRTGDGATARRWARPVVALWSGADPELQPVVARMEELLASRR